MITLKVTDLQYEIIKAAVASYYMDTFRALQPEEPELKMEISNPLPNVTTDPWDEPEAPWGLKKDGTPKARPGRKSSRKSVRKVRS